MGHNAGRTALHNPAFWAALKVPELTELGRKLPTLSHDIPKKAQALAAKAGSRALWMIVVGGTGTGKSTLFNALCARAVSRTGVERPKTMGAVAYAHTQADVAHHLPDFLRPLSGPDSEDDSGSIGHPKGLTLIEHSDPGLESFVLVDTPDLDSLVTEHQELSRDMLLMADVVLFVSSQEKYADDVLYQALVHLGQTDLDLYFVLNKVDPPAGQEGQDVLADVLESLDREGKFLQASRCVALPLIRRATARDLAATSEMQAFVQALTAYYGSNRGRQCMRRQQQELWMDMNQDLRQVGEILEKEEQMVRTWQERLQALRAECTSRLLQREEARFEARQRHSIQAEIRKLFSRFDLLAVPRRFVSRCLQWPLRLIGINWGMSRQERQEDLEQAKLKADSQPVQETVDEFNALVLERLLPSDPDSAAGRALRSPELAFTPDQVQARFQDLQDDLATWLNERFEKLAQEAPKGKALGIYTTSAVWGVLILSFEVAIGGGISLVEALVDSAIAPFVTKGAVELFAYQEIRSITRELSQRFQEGIVHIVTEQMQAYVQALEALLPAPEAAAAVEEWAGWSSQQVVQAIGGNQ